jgi:hypothetical protein
MIKLSMLREKKIGRLMEVARYDEVYENDKGEMLPPCRGEMNSVD